MKQTVLAIAIIGLSFPVLAQDADPLAGNVGINPPATKTTRQIGAGATSEASDD